MRANLLSLGAILFFLVVPLSHAGGRKMTPKPPSKLSAQRAALPRHRAAIDTILRRLKHQKLTAGERGKLMKSLAVHRARARKLRQELDENKTGKSLIKKHLRKKHLRRGPPPRSPVPRSRP